METPSSSKSPSGTSSPIGTPDIKELQGLQSDKRLQRLQFLVERSKIYASILTQRLAIPTSDSNDLGPGNLEEQTSEISTPPTTPPSTRHQKDVEPLVKRRRGRQSKAALAAQSAAKSASAKNTQRSILNFVKKEKRSSRDEDSNVVAKAAQAPLEPSKTGTGQPTLITGGTLHPYQVAGVQWMVSLFENGLNGILADEMGLGKTLQVISFIAYLIEHSIPGPFLIAAPLSTIENWIKEFNKFAPGIPVIKYHGTPEERAEIRNNHMNRKRATDRAFPIIVTSYEIINNDAKFLGHYEWKYIIVDEGHRLKNMNCRLIKQLKKFDSANRLLLTGTPLQNNLAELWSLLNFLLPDIFTDLELFQAWFESAGSDDGDFIGSAGDNLISSLHAILRPFLLRRLKTDISMFLPDKREYIIYGGLTDEQTELYERILQRTAREYVVDTIYQHRDAKYGKDRNRAKKTTGNGMKTSPQADEQRNPETGRPIRSTRSKGIESKHSSPSRSILRRGAKTRALANQSIDDTEDDDLQDDDEFIKSLQAKADARLSASIQEEYNDETARLIKQANNEARTKSFQNLVMQLRLACNSPYLFYYPWSADEPVDDKIITVSGKMMLLDKLATKLLEKQHKILIFSQFTKMLDLLEDWAYLKNWKYCRIDGSTDQKFRQEQMDVFNSDSSYKLFLLSTRSGGLGINLTSADTVIIFDSDWNPQQDLQAMDRVHRIGQTKPVVIYRLATSNTVEQKLLERAGAKRKLEQVVIESGRFKGFGFEGANQEETVENMKKELNKGKAAFKSSMEISNKDLQIIMDRSPEAYQRARDGAEGLSEHIASIISATKPKGLL
ncbi:Irc5p [Sugiyamaella lignohabitans]|uniref:Irc5p n=1 Tax=Sugiyamaella lignohabitans TaxID=796027 RepID=A0A167FUA7_9ASCO|nr:Irc5p [Sugiyamaella lignohabitans]ANB15712.1 Irc5p [Sugiyamaella lignohabitans]